MAGGDYERYTYRTDVITTTSLAGAHLHSQPTIGSRIVARLGDLANATEVRVTIVRQEQTPDGPLTTRDRRVFRPSSSL